MQYNLASQLDVARIQERLTALLKKGAVVELTEKAFKTPTSKPTTPIKRWGREQGWVMPDPCDEQLLKEIEIMMGRCRQYL